MNNQEDIKKALAAAVASRKLDSQTVESTARELSDIAHPIRRIDVCQLGICVDFFLKPDELSSLPDLLQGGGRLGGVQVFPFGIVRPDLFQVRVTRTLEERN